MKTSIIANSVAIFLLGVAAILSTKTACELSKRISDIENAQKNAAVEDSLEKLNAELDMHAPRESKPISIRNLPPSKADIGAQLDFQERSFKSILEDKMNELREHDSKNPYVIEIRGEKIVKIPVSRDAVQMMPTGSVRYVPASEVANGCDCDGQMQPSPPTFLRTRIR